MKWLMGSGVGPRVVRLLVVVGLVLASDVGLLPDALSDALRASLLGVPFST